MAARLSLVVGWSVLGTVLALVAYGALRPLPVPVFRGDLRALLPAAAEVPGWTVQEQDIAETPEMKRAVDEILNYDQALFVNYIKGAERISVYIAYWKPGKMPSRLVRGHTPDVCWVGGGWEIVSAGQALPFVASGPIAFPTEQRHMRHGNRDEWVVFWHHVMGQRIRNSSQPPPWYAAITDVFRRGLDQRNEQIFVRVSAPTPMEKWPKEWMEAFLNRYARAMP